MPSPTTIPVDPQTPWTPSPLPQGLVQAIRAGDCIAFVGAGFTAPAGLPSWQGLLRRIADRAQLDPPVATYARQLIDSATATDLEHAAQLLEDRLGTAFKPALVQAIGTPNETDEMRRRKELLEGIPFRAVLTTNFDTVLGGATQQTKGFRDLLRSPQHAWWSARRWQPHGDRGSPVMKLHGDLSAEESVVLTRRGYRELLHGGTAYGAFLRAMMATRTFLYLGFSFTDAYLNEIRSEILHMLGDADGPAPIAYAILPDVPDFKRDYLSRHEGLQVLGYESSGSDHRGFDAILQQLHDATNPAAHLRNLLTGKRILWVDPHRENNMLERGALEQVANDQLAGCRFQSVEQVDDALTELALAMEEGRA